MFNKLFGPTKPTTPDVTTTAAPGKTELPPELASMLTGAANPSVPNSPPSTINALNANSGSIQNPVTLNTPSFQIITPEKLATLSDDQKAVVERFVGKDSESIALMSGDSIAVLASGPQARKVAFNSSAVNRLLVKLGVRTDNRFGINWMKQAQDPTIKQISSSLKDSESGCRVMMMFKKHPDGKFPQLPEVMVPIDSLSKIPATINSNNIFKNDVAEVNSISNIGQSFLCSSSWIFNPKSALSEKVDDRDTTLQLARELPEAFLKAESALAKGSNPEKPENQMPAVRLFLPSISLRVTNASSANLNYDLFSDYQTHILEKGSSNLVTEKKPLTVVSSKTISREVPTKLAHAIAWKQLSMGKEFPSDPELLKKHAITVPIENAKLFATFNEQLKPILAPAPASAPVMSTPVTGMAA